MSSVQFRKHRVFRETPDVVFYDISVDDSNASDLVVHEGPAISPPNDVIGAKQFYIHMASSSVYTLSRDFPWSFI